MVLVASGPHGSGNASGSVGADTYSHNRFGQYVRNRTKPVNPNTALQQIVRSALTLLTTRWSQTVTALQRAAWELYASNVVMKNKLGEDTLLTGFNHYLRSNVIRLQALVAPVDAGPIVFELPEADPTYAVAGSEATQILTLTYDDGLAWADETGGYMIHFQGKPQNAQRNFFGGPSRYIGKTSGVDAAPPAGPDVLPVLFPIAEGQRQWVTARIARVDGRLSQPFSAHVLIGA